MATSLATGLAIERTSHNATPTPMVSAASRQPTRIITDRDDAAATELRADWIDGCSTPHRSVCLTARAPAGTRARSGWTPPTAEPAGFPIVTEAVLEGVRDLSLGSRPLEWCMGHLLSSDRFVLGGRVGVT
jgi:hypothetical protein